MRSLYPENERVKGGKMVIVEINSDHTMINLINFNTVRLIHADDKCFWRFRFDFYDVDSGLFDNEELAMRWFMKKIAGTHNAQETSQERQTAIPIVKD
jgi:hypothetical protein